MSILKSLLAHPLTDGVDVDEPRVTDLRRQIIQANSFLRQIYVQWYTSLAAAVPEPPGAVLELGSGPGFLDEYIADLITSEIFYVSHVDVVLDGHHLPFAAGALRALVMIDVLHHLPRPRNFLHEAARCVRPGGLLLMHEPWVTRWSRLVYGRLHYEPFEPEAQAWEFPPGGPLSGANGALPWIIFERDRSQFEREFPEWQIQAIHLGTPFQYLVSGGISMRPLMPGWMAGFWRGLESLLAPQMRHLAMFAVLHLRRTEEQSAL
jgi:SAM-dependent methyltransferase